MSTCKWFCLWIAAIKNDMIWDYLILCVCVCFVVCIRVCMCVCSSCWLWSICNAIKRSDILKVTMCTWYSEAINRHQASTSRKSVTLLYLRSHASLSHIKSEDWLIYTFYIILTFYKSCNSFLSFTLTLK